MKFAKNFPHEIFHLCGKQRDGRERCIIKIRADNQEAMPTKLGARLHFVKLYLHEFSEAILFFVPMCNVLQDFVGLLYNFW